MTSIVASFLPRDLKGIGIEPTRIYRVEDAREFLSGGGHGRGCDCSAGGR